MEATKYTAGRKHRLLQCLEEVFIEFPKSRCQRCLPVDLARYPPFTTSVRARRSPVKVRAKSLQRTGEVRGDLIRDYLGTRF